MNFINIKSTKIMIRRGEPGKYYWVTLQPGETIDLPEEEGIKNNLSKINVLNSAIGPTVVETKQFADSYTPDDLFFKDLKKINGIGASTAQDIVNWGTKEKLLEYIQKGESLPFRDDIEEKLRKEYGK